MKQSHQERTEPRQEQDAVLEHEAVAHIGELLILREGLPRSLHACFAKMNDVLALVQGDQGREVRRRVAELHARLRFGGWDDFADDPIARLDALLVEMAEIGDAIAEAYWMDL